MQTSTTRVARICDLSLSYDGRVVFDGLSLDIPAGLTLVTAGDSKGKTSLANIVAGALLADAGTIAIHETDCTGQSALLRQHVYYVDVLSPDYDQMTIAAFIAGLSERFPATRQDAFAAIADGLSLTPHLDKQLFMLSTGTKRKVWLAGGLIANADVTVFDDPFAAVDFTSIRFATHMLNTVFDSNASQACLMTGYVVPIDLQVTQHIDLGD